MNQGLDREIIQYKLDNIKTFREKCPENIDVDELSSTFYKLS